MSTISAQDIGPGGVNLEGRPIFIATDHTKFSPSVDRQLTDQEQLAWKSFQLWRTTLSMERRDNVYKNVLDSDYTNFHLSYHMLGTPFPVVEAMPGIYDTVTCIRWYEHAISASVGYAYLKWIKGKASSRHAKMMTTTRNVIGFGTFVFTEMCFAYRSMFRLSGYLPNDYECRKYGVLEDKQRLEQKKLLWDKYAAYKKEWCRRYDYHVYGIRPGENWNIFSACWLPTWTPSYGTITDYPLRKNPYYLSSKPLSPSDFLENTFFVQLEKSDNVPLVRARPEVKYIYSGPHNATVPVKTYNK